MRAVALLGAALLAVPSCASSGGARHADAALRGRVLSAPSCPVERSDSPCPPRPVVGAAVVALLGGSVTASTRSGADGRFRLALPAGRYVVRATNRGPFASSAQRTVVLSAARTVSVTLTVDSGIR